MTSWFYHALPALAGAAFGAAALTLGACSALTEPPPPEPVAVETTPVPLDASAVVAKPSATAAPTPPAPPPGPPEKITSTTLANRKGTAVANSGDTLRLDYVRTLPHRSQL